MIETLLFYYDFSSHQLPQFALTCALGNRAAKEETGPGKHGRTEMVSLFNCSKGLFSIPMTGNADELDRLFDKPAFS